MGQYNQNKSLSGDYVVDDICNATALRSDVHSAFDDRKFVFVPKESRWVVHFLDLTNTLGRLYHNAVLELDPGISLKFLLARFTWAVFPLVRQFLEVGVARNLRLRVTEEGRFKEVTRTFTAEEMRGMGPSIRGRNPSPKKMKAAPEMPVSGLRAIKRRRPYSSSPEKNAQNITLLASEQQGLQCANSKLNLTDDSPAASPPSDPPFPPTVASNFDTIQLIRSRRPSNPDLYCCDYNRAEAAMLAGLPGEKEYGGAHLCLECLGVEYRDVDRDEY